MVDNLIDPPHSGHAVLSQNFLKQPEDLLPAHRTFLNQAHHHPQMFDQRVRTAGAHPRAWPWGGLPLLERWGLAAALVVGLFPLSSLLRPVPSNTPSDRLPTPMGLTATKRTTKVLTPHSAHVFAPGVARIGEKENPAMPASGQASSQVGLGFQDRSQKQIILQHQRTDPFPTVPVLAKLKMLLDPACKKT